MKIAVIGAGAMGSIYGGRLSLHNEVFLTARRESLVQTIQEDGLKLVEDGEEHTYHPQAVMSADAIGTADLVIVFVKALQTEAALTEWGSIIGPDTYVLTLQNGAGHEAILKKFVRPSRIIIGTTEDNGTVLSPGVIRHGGTGRTNVGIPAGDSEAFLPKLKEAFDSCGFQTIICEKIHQLIWNKLFTNATLSTTTALLQVPMGYVGENPNAWHMVCSLLHEAITVARALGLEGDEKLLQEKIRQTALASPQAITSICADIKAGRKTEVDTISGAVCAAARQLKIPVPCQEFAVQMIHALEAKER